MPELSDDQYEDLNFAINNIRIGDAVTVKYYRDYRIRTLFGAVTNLPREKRTICVKGKTLNFNELIEIGL